MNKVLGTVVIVIASSMALPVVAQEDANVTAYDFRDELVPGDRARPDGEVLQARLRSSRPSLIRIRQHFVPEMLKSVEDI